MINNLSQLITMFQQKRNRDFKHVTVNSRQNGAVFKATVTGTNFVSKKNS